MRGSLCVVLSKAYEVLSDPEKRAKLDQEVPMESGSSKGATQHSTFRQRRPDGDRDPSANHDRAKSGQHSSFRQHGPSTNHDRAGSTGQQSTSRGSKDRASPGESSNMFSGQRCRLLFGYFSTLLTRFTKKLLTYQRTKPAR
jgi:DnaJ-class molecular chaperone